jgi:Zn-dependent protease with chaperone function
VKLTLRALVAVFLLVGAQLLVLALVAAVAFTVRALVDDGQRGYGVFRAALFALGLAVVACWSLVRSAVRRPPPLPGVALTREAQPAIWAEIDAVAQLAVTRAPDELRLVEAANAAVVEEARSFRRSRRTLLLGAPLVVALDQGALRVVLAHELGHYSRRHTVLARVTYRGQQLLGDLVLRLGPRTLVGRLLDLYGRLYLAVAAAVSRNQEHEADRLAAEISGAQLTSETVAALPELAAAWHHFRRSDVLYAEERGKRPDRLLMVFGERWLNPSCRAALQEGMPRWDPPASAYDTHPRTEARVARLRLLAGDEQTSGRPAGASPALELLREPEATLGALEELIYEGSGLVPTPWTQLLAEKAAADAAGAARQLGWSAQQEKLAEHATVGVLLDLVEAGEGPRLAGRFMDRGAPLVLRRKALSRLLLRTLEHALVERHGLHHVPGDDGRPVLRSPDGTPVPPPSLVEAAAQEPGAVGALRAWAQHHDLLDRPLPQGSPRLSSG